MTSLDFRSSSLLSRGRFVIISNPFPYFSLFFIAFSSLSLIFVDFHALSFIFFLSFIVSHWFSWIFISFYWFSVNFIGFLCFCVNFTKKCSLRSWKKESEFVSKNTRALSKEFKFLALAGPRPSRGLLFSVFHWF